MWKRQSQTLDQRKNQKEMTGEEKEKEKEKGIGTGIEIEIEIGIEGGRDLIHALLRDQGRNHLRDQGVDEVDQEANQEADQEADQDLDLLLQEGMRMNQHMAKWRINNLLKVSLNFCFLFLWSILFLQA